MMASTANPKMKNAFSHRQMQDDDVILPPTYKENTGWQSIINIGIGLILGAVMIFFLVIPARERSLNYEHNQEMLSYTDRLNLANQELAELENELSQYRQQNEEAQAQIAEMQGNSNSVLAQYATVAEILQAYRNEDFRTAVQLYIDMDASLITDENMLNIFAGIQADMTANAPAELEAMAAEAEAAGDHELALHYYESYMAINDRNPQIIYNMAMIYQAMGDTETADQLFGQVIMNFSDSELAAQAQEQRGY